MKSDASETSGYFNDVITLWVSRYDYNKGWILRPHSHCDYYQIIYCISGEGDAHTTDQEGNEHTYKLHPSCCLFAHPGVIHSIDGIDRELKTLDVKFAISSKALCEKVREIPDFVENCDPKVRDYLENIRMEGETRDYEFYSYSNLYLSLVILELLRMLHPVPNVVKMNPNFFYQEDLSDISIKVLAYIQNNYNRKIRAEDISSALNYSYRYLSRIVTKELGYSPVDLLERFRCHIAKEKLILTDMTLKEIAEDAGYPNIHQFSRSFCRIAGEPPASFRRNYLLGIRKDINFKSEFVNENNTLR